MDLIPLSWLMGPLGVAKPTRRQAKIKYDRIGPTIRTLCSFSYRSSRKSQPAQSHPPCRPETLLYRNLQ